MIPTLHHPIPILVQPLNVNDTVYDEHAREEIQIVKRVAEFKIPAQMNLQESETHGQFANYDRGGKFIEFNGYALVRQIDLNKVSWIPKPGDRIVELYSGLPNAQQIKLYIQRIRPVGHYPNLGPTLYKLYFSTRQPSHV